MKGRRRHSTLGFILILVLTALVWAAIAMSEIREYPLRVKVHVLGFDHSQFAVVQVDSSLTLQVESSGFNALLYSLKDDTLTLSLDINGESVRHYSRQGTRGLFFCHAVAVNDLGDRFANELTEMGMRQVGSAKDSLRVILSERRSKVLPVDIDPVAISFAEGYGLYGNPTVTPSKVTLYGDEESLAKIDKVSVKKFHVSNLMRSGRFYLDIDTSPYDGDVHASASRVLLSIPVEQYIEREYSLPIDVAHLDSASRLNLYPDKVTLRVWVPKCDIASVTAERFSVTVDYRDALSHLSRLKTRLARFPKTVRLHSLSPSEVNYVVIK